MDTTDYDDMYKLNRIVSTGLRSFLWNHLSHEMTNKIELLYVVSNNLERELARSYRRA